MGDTKLSIYLTREGTTFNTALRGKYLPGDGAFEEPPLLKELTYECKALVQKNKLKPPRWTSFVAGYFDLGDSLRNASNSFLLLLRVKDRVFVATFGYGHNAIDRTKVEQGFGLKVTLNEIGADQIETLDTRNIDLVTKQRRTHVNIGSPVSEFGLNENLDWVRFVSGKPVTEDLARKLSGSDALAITSDTTIEDLGTLCETLLSKFQSEEYKKHFGFIDYLKPLLKNDALVNTLNDNLREVLVSRSFDRITIAHPEIPDGSVVSYKISAGHKSIEVEEVSLEQVYAFMDKYPDVKSEENLTKVFIIGLDSEGEPKTPRYRLRDFLVCELTEGTETYILSLGEWFFVNNDYVQTVKERVRNIPDLTEELGILPIHEGESEGDYNERLSSAKDWLLLDRKLFIFSGTSKFEIADLLTPDAKYLCVKKMSSSATLSHLFAQGSVSAKLLRSVPDVAERARKLYTEKWPKNNDSALNTPTFVYVIPTKKKGPMSDCLFFFSLINLIDHVDSIKASGYTVALCKVDYQSA